MRRLLIFCSFLCSFLCVVEASAAGITKITVTPPGALVAGAATWTVAIENISGVAQPLLTLVIDSGPGVVTIDPQLSCVFADGGQRCALPPLGAGAMLTYRIAAQYPFFFGTVGLSALVRNTFDELDQAQASRTFWREFAVTSTADSGPGSLRQAILDMNATEGCLHDPIAPKWIWPCKAALHLAGAVPAEGWFTIRPLTPLPPLTAFITSIDGSTQGQQVFMDGSLLATGHGLTIDAEGFWPSSEIRGLVIGGFPWNGIYAARGVFLTVTDCFIGLDPTGQRAHPNGARGIVVEGVWGEITGNVISGNRRSGIFLAGPTGNGTRIRNNRIGVAAHDDTPIGNGASGIFVGDFYHAYANPVVENNVVANNADFGIALTANAPIAVLGNSIHDNGLGGIDVGLDGPTERRDGVPGVEGGVIPPPVITSVRYANGVTTIEGVSTAGNSFRQVLLFANASLDRDGRAEGERYLGITAVKQRADTSFVLEYPGDLRGQYITGISYANTRYGYDDSVMSTSEFSRPVRAE